MADDAATTTDTSGIARTGTGEIAAPPTAPPLVITRTRSDSSTTPTPTPAPPPAEPEAGETLLTDKAEPKAEAPPKAPEEYEDFKVPDGFTLDPEVATKAGTLFKELGLSQDGAQKLIDLYTAETAQAFEAPFKAYQDMRKGWRDEVIGDRELSHRLPQIKTNVTQMLNTHLGQKLADQFREAMDMTGVGDHPAFVRAFDVLSSLLVEPRAHVAGARPSPFGQDQRAQPQSAASAVYPHLPTNAR